MHHQPPLVTSHSLGDPQRASKKVLEGLKDNTTSGRTAPLGRTGQDIVISASVGCKDFVKSQAKLWKNIGGSKLDLQQIKTIQEKKIKERK